MVLDKSVLQEGLENLILHLHEAVLLENENRQVLLVNKMFTNLFTEGAPPEALIGMDCSEAAEQSKDAFTDPEGFVRRVDELLEKQEVVIGDLLEMKDGRWLERDYIPIFVDKQYFGHLWKYRDVTEQQQKKRETQLLVRELADVNILKDRIFSMVSHDLRSPHANLLATFELADSGLLTSIEDYKELLGRIRPRFEQSMELLEDLLSWSRNQMQSAPIKKEKRFVRKCIAHEEGKIMERARNKDITFEIKVPESAFLYCDYQAMRTVLRNLVQNALKFTPRGGTITFLWQENEGEKRVGIQDNGIGISPEKLTLINDPHGMLKSTPGTEQEPGTGLGLLIVRDLLKRLGASLYVESRLHEGSTFWMCFPRASQAMTK